MANTLKSKKQPKISEENLNPDKEADVSVTDVVKDERTSKIMGAISLLITLFLFDQFGAFRDREGRRRPGDHRLRPL